MTNYFAEDKYYVCYDKETNKIVALCPDTPRGPEPYVQVPKELYLKLMSGAESTANYTIGPVKNDDGSTVITLIPKEHQVYHFRNTMFEWISDAPTDTTELVVEWDKSTNGWFFSLTDVARQRIGNTLDNTVLVFFVMLEHDFDFLIRTIIIDSAKLFGDRRYYVPFEEKLEENIDKISIATRLQLQSYGLKIND